MKIIFRNHILTPTHISPSVFVSDGRGSKSYKTEFTWYWYQKKIVTDKKDWAMEMIALIKKQSVVGILKLVTCKM